MDKATSIAEARRDGLAEGKAEGRAETARRLGELGVDDEVIAKATGLSKDDVVARSGGRD